MATMAREPQTYLRHKEDRDGQCVMALSNTPDYFWNAYEQAQPFVLSINGLDDNTPIEPHNSLSRYDAPFKCFSIEFLNGSCNLNRSNVIDLIEIQRLEKIFQESDGKTQNPSDDTFTTKILLRLACPMLDDISKVKDGLDSRSQFIRKAIREKIQRDAIKKGVKPYSCQN